MADSAYVALAGSNKVVVVNTGTFAVVATLTVGTQPIGVVVTADRKWVYVTNATDGTVSKINATTNTVTATVIPVGTQPSGIAISPDSSTILVTNFGSYTVSIISTATDTVIGTVPMIAAPGATGTLVYAVCISPDGKTGYVATQINGSSAAGSYVSVIDIATQTNTLRIPLGLNEFAGVLTKTFRSIAITPDGLHVVMLGNISGRNSVISTVSHTVVTTMLYPTGNPFGVCVLPNNTVGYWSDSGGHIVPFNPTTFTVGTPAGIATTGPDELTGITPLFDSSLVYVSDDGLSPGTTGHTLWQFNAVSPGTHSSISLGSSVVQPCDIGLSYYPIPPPPTPSYPGSQFIPKLFIPIKGKVSADYTQAELYANWLAIEIWSQRWLPPAPVALFFPDKHSTDPNALNANWIVFQNWVNQINQAEKAPYPTLFIPRKASNAPTDLDIDFLRIENWANGL
jgi:YVTN family beta-propeller protein